MRIRSISRGNGRRICSRTNRRKQEANGRVALPWGDCNRLRWRDPQVWLSKTGGGGPHSPFPYHIASQIPSPPSIARHLPTKTLRRRRSRSFDRLPLTASRHLNRDPSRGIVRFPQPSNSRSRLLQPIMGASGGSSSARFHGIDRFYSPPAVRRQIEQQQKQKLQQQQQSPTHRPARPKPRPAQPAAQPLVESRDAADNRAESDDSSSKQSVSSSPASPSPVQPPPAGNLDRFLEFTTPVVPARFLPKVWQ